MNFKSGSELCVSGLLANVAAYYIYYEFALMIIQVVLQVVTGQESSTWSSWHGHSVEMFVCPA